MPRVALPDSLQLCRISGCLYTPFVQKTNISYGFIVDSSRHRNFSYDTIDELFMRYVFKTLPGIPIY
jgi:hypothetical protein